MKFIFRFLERCTVWSLTYTVNKLIQAEPEWLEHRSAIHNAYAVKAVLTQEYPELTECGMSLVVYVRNGFPILFLKGRYGNAYMLRVFT